MTTYTFRHANPLAASAGSRSPEELAAHLGVVPTGTPSIVVENTEEGERTVTVELPGVTLTPDQVAQLKEVAATNLWGELEASP